MILITGATGQLGRIVIDHLLKKVPAKDIAILVRDENKANDLKEKGISVRTGNYHDKASLAKAMQGVERLLLISSSDFNDRLSQHKNAIDAAKNAGVKHILYTGVSMKDIKTSPLKPLLEDHFQTEDYIREKGFTYTFLQNSLYLEVIPMFLGEKVFETGVYFPAGQGRVSFVSREDLGEVTAQILSTAGHENNVYQLTGSDTYSFQDIANELSAIAGKQVNYIDPQAADFEAALKSFGLPEHIIHVSLSFAAGMKHDDFNFTSNSVEQLLGHKAIDLSTFLKKVYSA